MKTAKFVVENLRNYRDVFVIQWVSCCFGILRQKENIARIPTNLILLKILHKVYVRSILTKILFL